MNSLEIFNEIKTIAQSEIRCDVGLANIESLDYPHTENYSSAFSIIVPLSKGVLKEINDKPTITYFAHYRAVNKMINAITLKAALALEKHHYLAYPVPASQSDPFSDDRFAGVFPHKTAAVLSGKGWIGKNDLFIHHQFGSAVRLGTVLTNIDAPIIKPLKSKCGECHICKKICPAQAIEGNEWQIGVKRNELIDVRACSEYMKTAFQNIGRGVVCGLCMVHCPYSQLNGEPNENKSL